MPLFDVMFVETNPAPVKHAMSRLGLCTGDMRLPMVPLSDKSKAAVDRVLASAWFVGEVVCGIGVIFGSIVTAPLRYESRQGQTSGPLSRASVRPLQRATRERQ